MTILPRSSERPLSDALHEVNDGKAVADNLLQRDFTTSAPNRKWMGDITYLHTEEGWLYLAVIIDVIPGG